jgi:hypothetical protein
MSNDSHLFRTAGQLEQSGYERNGSEWQKLGSVQYAPLYEGKMAFYFDHRYGDFVAAEEKDDADYREIPRPSVDQLRDPEFEVTPRYWVPKGELDTRLASKAWEAGWLLAHRGLTNATNERTFVTFVLPRSAIGNSIPAWLFDCSLDKRKIAGLSANTASLVCDFAARQKIGGTNLNFFYLEQFPILPPDFYTASRLAFVVPIAYPPSPVIWAMMGRLSPGMRTAASLFAPISKPSMPVPMASIEMSCATFSIPLT